MKFDLHSLYYDVSRPCTDDISWANRMTWICANVLWWAFTEHDKLAKDWNSLLTTVSAWEEQRPSTFDPICRRDADTAKDR